MHLFGDTSEPHLSHFHARRDGTQALLGWEVRNAPDLTWRVLRSETSFAEEAAAGPGGGQTLVMEGTQTHATDEGLDEGSTYYYTVFVADEHGTWHRQVKARLHPGDHHLRWHYDDPGVDKVPLAHDGLLLGLYELGSPWDPV
jgi:hypothetical protein